MRKHKWLRNIKESSMSLISKGNARMHFATFKPVGTAEIFDHTHCLARLWNNMERNCYK